MSLAVSFITSDIRNVLRFQVSIPADACTDAETAITVREPEMRVGCNDCEGAKITVLCFNDLTKNLTKKLSLHHNLVLKFAKCAHLFSSKQEICESSFVSSSMFDFKGNYEVFFLQY